ncbi:MAG: GNAT family N-acetyltransferase [Ardenticatenaceae bacterium]|nr:GNAT family N-acetyltransferase [Ardenticatenaceae bacterium]
MNNFDVRIRPFTPQDQSDTRQLILAGLGGHFGFIDETMNPDLNDIWQQYVVPGNVFVVAEMSGQIVGSGALIEESKGVGRLVRMSVSPDRQRRGIGRMLVQHLVQKANEKGYRRLLVETNHDWYDAIGLYQNCGFCEYGRDEESVHMQQELSSVLNLPGS